MGFLQNIFYNKSTRRLRQMLESVRMRDFSLQYSLEHLHGEERRMAEEINAVIREFRESEHQHVSDSHLYDAMLSKVDAILIATDENGRVRWMNKAAIDGLCGFRFDNLDQLAVLHHSLPLQLRGLKRGPSQLVSYVSKEGEEKQYAASRTQVFVSGIPYILYSLQSVASILEQGEIEVQQKLIRVLTHEIMNSLAPIVSLSNTLAENLSNEGAGERYRDDEVQMVLSTISRRANGLMDFVQRYRMVSNIPHPDLENVSVGRLMEDFQRMCASVLREDCHVEYDVQCAETFIRLDSSQIQQVLINLMKNASETEATEIRMKVALSENGRHVVMSIEDNGGGISQEVVDNIFTPFFTTKEGGQGIGLAVCRQVVSNHGGLIGVENKTYADGTKGARFTVRLPM